MKWRSIGADMVLAVAVVAGITVIIGAVESVSHFPNISNLYVIGIAILAGRRGLYPALVASVLAFLAFDWFFIPPLHVFTVDEPSQYLALITLLVTSVIIGQLLAVARSRATEAHLRQRQTQLLYDVSHAALSSPQMSPVYALALWRLNGTLGLTGSRLYLKERDGLRTEASSGAVADVGDDATWLRQVLDEGRLVAVWTQSRNNVRVETDLGADQLTQIYLPLRIEARVEGVLVVGPKKDHTGLSAEDRRHACRRWPERVATRVLVVDDEAEVRTAVRRGLELMGYEIEVAADGVEGVAKVDSWRPDVVLLDLAMPKMGGLSAIEQIRTWSKIPIIVLSVMGEEADKVRALETGADDYLTKPFGLQELHARIRVALRRSGAEPILSNLQFGDVRLDVDKRLATVAGVEVHLTPIEYELFKQLATAGGRVITHRLLLRNVWGPQYENEVNYLRPVITSLRKKLGTRLIKTEPAVGYRLQSE